MAERTDEDEPRMPWEIQAEDAVSAALEDAEFDDIRRVVALSDREHTYGVEFTDIDNLRSYLEELYDEQWYGNVPFDSGEAVFESDSNDFVSELLAERGVEEFFSSLRDPEGTELIVSSRELIEDANRSLVLRTDVLTINEELIRYLSQHPERMRNLAPRRFEELVAELFRNMGYTVELTPRTRDGGLDIIAIERNDLGAALTLIECKRYSEQNRVGVDVVRGLYGVVEQRRATRGIIATTSYFTRDAATFRDTVPYRLSLADFDLISKYLREWSTSHRR